MQETAEVPVEAAANTDGITFVNTAGNGKISIDEQEAKLYADCLIGFHDVLEHRRKCQENQVEMSDKLMQKFCDVMTAHHCFIQTSRLYDLGNALREFDEVMREEVR